MNTNDILQLVVLFSLLVGVAPVLGRTMARLFSGETVFLSRIVAPLERAVYRVAAIRSDEEMSWKQYFLAVLVFNLVGLVSLWGVMLTQAWLPFNPMKLGNVPWTKRESLRGRL